MLFVCVVIGFVERIERERTSIFIRDVVRFDGFVFLTRFTTGIRES